MNSDNHLLSVRGLEVSFFGRGGLVRAVDGVCFDMYKGKTLALVGESGCGKSVTALSLLRLIADPPGKITGGEILLHGKDLLGLSKRQMRKIRGNNIAMIFQEPMTSLNPVYTIGRQIVEAVELHQKVKGAAARKRAVDMLRLVGIADPQRRAGEYPHQMSGGMRQRVMIAMALSCDPDILIADEPTTALDVTIQGQILELIKNLQHRNKMSVLLITHDLAVVAENADDVAVMYASRIREKADVITIFDRPSHPYTRALHKSLPSLADKGERLEVIPGSVPDGLHYPKGCKFYPRCPYCPPEEDSLCRTREPDLQEIEPGHWVACWEAKKINQ